MKTFAPIFLVILASVPSATFALTVRTKSDLRLWETVTDRSRPLYWVWEAEADAARLTFSNRLTRTVSTLVVDRQSGEARGFCSHPVSLEAGEALVVATLEQTAVGVEVAHEAAELAYVSGVASCDGGGAVATQPITVRTKGDREWYRVRSPRLAAFDASWWNVAGPSGYEVMWRTPAGPHRVVREFEGVGVVDETVLKFGTLGLMLLLR